MDASIYGEGAKSSKGSEWDEGLPPASGLSLLSQQRIVVKVSKKGGCKNYSTRDSRMVTHCSTNRAIRCLNMAERTGSLVFIVL